MKEILTIQFSDNFHGKFASRILSTKGPDTIRALVGKGMLRESLQKYESQLFKSPPNSNLPHCATVDAEKLLLIMFVSGTLQRSARRSDIFPIS